MSEVRYKIVNTTIKKPSGQGGEDTRSMVEKVGHSVQFRTADNKLVILPPGRATIISSVDGGLLGLKRAGMVSIEQIKDVATALKEHTLEQKETKSVKKKAASKKKAANRKAKSVEMGKDDHGEGTPKEANEGYDGATNPDGAGNHRVVAPSKKKKKKKKVSRRRVVDAENLEDGDMLDEVKDEAL